MASSVKCPTCDAAIPAGRLSAGRRVTCPECDTSFEVRGGPPSSGNAKSRKPGAAGRAGGAGATRVPALLVAGGGGAVALLLVALGIIALRSGGDGSQPAAGQPAAAPAAHFDAARFAIVESPLPENELPERAPQDSAPAIAPASAAQRSTAPASPAANAGDPGAADASEPRWNLPVSPAPTPEPVAENLRIAFSVLASLNGPFALGTASAVDEPDAAAAGEKKQAKKKKPVRSSRSNKNDAAAKKPPEVAQPGTKVQRWRTPLIDLRTGTETATFWATRARPDEQRLSPGGKYMTTPVRAGFEDRTITEGVLSSWEQEEQEPLAEIKLPGYVSWIDFVAEDRVAMFASEPEPVIRITDVTTGETVHTIRLEKNAFPTVGIGGAYNRTSNVPPFWYAPGEAAVAVSPTGEYAALSGRDGVTLVSLAEGKEVGVLTIEQGKPGLFPRNPVIDFSPDGRYIYHAATRAHPVNRALGRPCFLVWEVATGRLVADSNIGSAPGKLLPGPDEGTFLCAGTVIETGAGQAVYGVRFVPLRWSGPDRLLALVKEGENKTMLANVPFDRADYAEKSEAARAPLAPRPKVLAADRSGIKGAASQPPATWTAPQAGTAARETPAEKGVIGQWPPALGNRQGVVFSYQFTMTPIAGIGERGRLVMYAQRVDLRTGKKLGETKKLWPWIAKPDRHHATQPEQVPPPLAALAADDNRLALRDPADLARVDVWAEDFTRVAGLKPYGAAPIDWLGWSANGALLTIGGGDLTAWDSSSGKALYELKGNYIGPADYGPGRKWLAAAAPDGVVDIIDLDTGKCLGRCRAIAPGAPFFAVTVAPGGKSLAAIRPGVGPPVGATKKPAEYVADLWDLATGRAASVPFGESPFQVVNWNTPRHLVAASGMNVALIDAAHAEIAWSGTLPGLDYIGYRDQKRDYLKATPDGRIWAYRRRRTEDSEWTERDVWSSQRIPDTESPGVKLALTDDIEYLTVADSLRVEVDAGEKARSAAAAKKIAGTLQRRGFKIAPGGWVLRVSSKVTDSTEKLTTASGGSLPIPNVAFVWQLIGPDGKVGWESSTTVGWAQQSSQYFQGAKLDYSKFPEPGTIGPARIEKFDFGKRDIRTAIIEEQLEKPRKALDVPEQLPARLVKAGGSHKDLPVMEMVKIE